MYRLPERLRSSGLTLSMVILAWGSSIMGRGIKGACLTLAGMSSGTHHSSYSR